MNLKKIIYYIIWLVLLSLIIWNQSVFWASWEIAEKTTIREMQEDIEILEQEKSLLEFKWNTFKIWNITLWELLRSNLTQSEKLKLTEVVSSYNEVNIFEENILKDIINVNWDEQAQRDKLLLLKTNFYTSLEPFVQEEKLEELNVYAWVDKSFDEQKKNVDSKIQKIKIEKQEKVDHFQTKIEDNNKVIRENIENKIFTEVKEKLDVFVSQEEFLELPNIAKKGIFNKVIKKLEYESIRLTNLQNSTSIIEEKIIIFRVVIDLLKEYTISWD